MIDFSDMKGNFDDVLSVVIECAKDRRPLLLVGPPGSGKTMLARRLPGILPPPSPQQDFEAAMIRSWSSLPPLKGEERPFRAPHYTASVKGMIGVAWPKPRPGECSLAHGGMLFLDDLPEFSSGVIESVKAAHRQKEVTLNRCTVPADSWLVASACPCPCGFFGTFRCTCTDKSLENYRIRLARTCDGIDWRVIAMGGACFAEQTGEGK